MTGESDSQIMSAGVGLVCVCVGGVGGGWLQQDWANQKRVYSKPWGFRVRLESFPDTLFYLIVFECHMSMKLALSRFGRM